MAKVATRQGKLQPSVGSAKLRTKRRTRDFSGTVITGLVVAILGQAAAAIFYSPLFAVSPNSLRVVASPLCSEVQVRSLIEPDLPRSIARLPIARWSDAITNIPAVKSVSITTTFPNKCVVEIKDRQPLFVANLTGLGDCILDGDLVPFMIAQSGESNLPKLTVQSNGSQPELGERIAEEAQVGAIKTITQWLNNHRDVAITSISIQGQHLSFVIKQSNVNVLLGTPRRLSEKLESLGILITKRPDLLSSRKYAAVNLFSDEYPALVIRSGSPDETAVR